MDLTHPPNEPTLQLRRGYTRSLYVSSLYLIVAAFAAFALFTFSLPADAAKAHATGARAFAFQHHYRDSKPRPPETGRAKGKARERSIAKRVREGFPSWRKQELNKVLREVSRRDAARGNKFLAEGISGHEGGRHSGHTIKH